VIDFRYHLVSIVAVFLALTVGLVLGTTMLQDPLLNTLQSETSDLRGQSEDLRSERDVADKVNAGADEMAEAVSSDMLAGRLADLSVVVVTSPGANHEVADGLAERVEEAGGEVVGRIAVTDALVDAGNATFVDELSIQVSQDPDSLSGGPYEKAGTELGRALATVDAEIDVDGETGEGTAEDAGDGESVAAGGHDGGYDAEAVLDAFSEGGLIQVEGEPAVSADALIVLAPAAGADQGADREAANAVLTTVTTALHREVGAAVLAGDVPSSRGDGMLAQARAAEPEFATADVTGRPMGDIIAVLALAENLGGGAGAYGIGDGVRGFLPDPLPSAREVGDQASGSAEDAVSDEGGRVDESRRTVPDGE